MKTKTTISNLYARQHKKKNILFSISAGVEYPRIFVPLHPKAI